jgi:hypothetical protein
VMITSSAYLVWQVVTGKWTNMTQPPATNMKWEMMQNLIQKSDP